MINKITNLISNPTTLLVLWLGFLLSPLLSWVRLFYIVGESGYKFHVRGASTLLFYAPYFLALCALMILLFWFKELIAKGLSTIRKKTLGILSLFSLGFILIAKYLMEMEYNSYPNFLYQYSGITVAQLELMSFVAGFQLLLFLITLVYESSFKPGTKRLPKKNQTNHSFRTRASLMMAFVGISGLLALSAQTLLNWTLLLGEESGGYETRIGKHYKYIVLLSEHPPTDSLVIHPPQGDRWPAIGNQPVLRYFLYPRTLVSGALLNDQEDMEKIKVGYFTEVPATSGDAIWPIIIDSNKSIIFDGENEIKYKSLEEIFTSDEGKVFKVVF